MTKTLEKAKIIQVKPKGPEIAVLFNPGEYRVNKVNQFAEIPVPGLGAPILQFGHGNARTLTMQLFFDSYDPQAEGMPYEKDKNVSYYTGQVTNLLEINAQLHAPPICQFVWGGLQFTGVLERADVRFTMFLHNGTPVRATMDVTFKECTDVARPKVSTQSANFMKQHVVRPGDTLSGIASELYEDPAKWRPIADANNIDNPLAIEPGQILLIPAIE